MVVTGIVVYVAFVIFLSYKEGQHLKKMRKQPKPKRSKIMVNSINP